MPDKFRIAVSPDFFREARKNFERVRQARLDALDWVECVPMPSLENLTATPESLDGCDAVFALALRVNAASLVGLKRLTAVTRWGVGYDRIDVQALTAADVMLTITPNSVRRPVAEAVLTFVFALSKNLPLQDRVARAGGWRGDLPKLGRNVQGTVLGSLGCGNIGRELFRASASLGFARMIAHDPYVKQEDVATLGVELVDMETLFRESDYVCINTLLNERTRGLVGERHLRMMKPSAYLINTARGPVVQEAALVRALREGWIAGAGIDVYDVEPPPKNHPLFELDNVILAPHAMAWTDELMFDNGSEACENVLAVARGMTPASVVNREVLERPGMQAKLAALRERFGDR